jgi:type I restriction enzyme S subunit
MLYLEARFKDTIIGSIPSDWDISMVKETGKVVTGKTPSTKNALFWNGDVPFVTPTDINHMKLQGKTERRVTESGLKESNEIPSGSLMVTCIASIGKNAVSKERCCTNQQINSIIPNTDFDVDYLYYMIEHMKPRLEALAGKTAVPILNKTSFEQVRLAKPKRTEQQKIAEILSNIDVTIQKTDELIETTGRLNIGLMQRLLTEGIGHSKFKDTNIGRIPEEWNVKALQDVAEIRGSKRVPNVKDVTFIPMELVSNNKVYVDYVVKSPTEIKSYTYCEAGDLLLAKITPSLENGKQGIVPKDINGGFALATTEVFPIHCRDINTLYLFYVLKLSTYRNKIIASMIGTTGRLRASKGAVEKLTIPLPSLHEQTKIAEILSIASKKVDTLHKERTYLGRIKIGFMSKLLSGRIRVK